MAGRRALLGRRRLGHGRERAACYRQRNDQHKGSCNVTHVQSPLISLDRHSDLIRRETGETEVSPTLSLVNAEIAALTSNEMRVGSSEEAAEDVHACHDD